MQQEFPKILTYGNQALYEKAQRVSDPTTDEIKSITQMMIKMVEQEQAIGLAATQINIPLSIVVYHIPTQTLNPKYQLTPEYDPNGVPMTVLINPELKFLGDEMVDDWEGCLSLPGMLGKVPRYKHLELTYQNLTGETIQRKCSGFHARALQHECDHLNGILYSDRVIDARHFGFTDDIASSPLFKAKDAA